MRKNLILIAAAALALIPAISHAQSWRKGNPNTIYERSDFGQPGYYAPEDTAGNLQPPTTSVRGGVKAATGSNQVVTGIDTTGAPTTAPYSTVAPIQSVGSALSLTGTQVNLPSIVGSPGAYNNITVDAFGRITAVRGFNSSDISGAGGLLTSGGTLTGTLTNGTLSGTVASAATATATNGTTAQTLANAFGEGFDALRNGLKCDGSTNDSPAVNVMISKVTTLTGNIIYLRPNPALSSGSTVCILMGPFVLPSNTTLQGEGGITLMAAPNSTASPSLIATVAGAQNVYVRGLILDGNLSNRLPALFTGSISGNTLTVTAVSQGALALNQQVFDGAQSATLGTITAVLGGGQYTLSASHTIASQPMSAAIPSVLATVAANDNNVIFEDDTFQNNYSTAITVNSGAQNVYVKGRRTRFNNIGNYATTSGLLGDTKSAINFGGTAVGTQLYNGVEDATFTNIGGDAVDLSYQGYFLFHNNRCLFTRASYGTGFGNACLFDVGSLGTQALDNTSLNASGNGFDIAGITDFLAIGNKVEGSGVAAYSIGNGSLYGITTGASGITISGGTGKDSGWNSAGVSAGVRLTNATGSGGESISNVVVSGMDLGDDQATPTQNYGVRVDPSVTSSNIQVSSAQNFAGNTVAPLSGVSYSPVQGDASAGTRVASLGSATRTFAAAASDIFNNRDFGAFGDGTIHTAASALGISSLAGLIGWTAPNGTHPYSWAGTYPHGTLFNLPVSAPSAIGATTLTFGVTHEVGLSFKLSANTASGNATLTFLSVFGLVAGTPVTDTQGCLPANDTVNQMFNTQVTLTAAATSQCNSGDTIYFGIGSAPTPLVTKPLSGQTTATVVGGTTLAVQASTAPNLATLPSGSTVGGANIVWGTQVTATNLSGGTVTLASPATVAVTAYGNIALYAGWSVYLTDVTGVYQGMQVDNTGLGTPVYVEYVNQSTNEVRLSQPVGSIAGVNLFFHWPSSLMNELVNGTTQVTGPGVPASTLVSAVNLTTGVVTISNALTAAANPATGVLATTPLTRGTPFTFYAPWTDAQASALSMDFLGTQAAEQAAEAAGGGEVYAPSGHYEMNAEVIFPVTQIGAAVQPVVSLRGAGDYQTVLETATDLGKDNYILSCGDPTGTPENGNGIYGGSGAGAYCNGYWRDFEVQTVGYNANKLGIRPTLAGVPISMGGLRSGPRRELQDLNVFGFNDGILFQGDHTKTDFVRSSFDFANYHIGPAMTTLFGDNNYSHDFFQASTFAGIMVDPTSYINAAMYDVYLGYNPYGVWCQDGAGSQSCIFGTTIDGKPNWESQGCATIKDGNLWPNATAYDPAGDRAIEDTVFNTLFTNNNTAEQLAGGCTWNAYIDMYGAYGMRIENIRPDTFPVVTGGSTIIRLHRATNFAPDQGGILLSGQGLYTILTNYGLVCQEIVTGGNDFGSDFWNTGGDRAVTLTQPGEWVAHPVMLLDSGETTMVLGTVLESTAYTASNRLGAVRGGTASAGTAIVQGLALQSNSACSMYQKYIIAGTKGTELPVAVSAAAPVGTILKMPATATGIAVAGSSVTDGQMIGMVSNPNSASTSLVYVQTYFPSPQ